MKQEEVPFLNTKVLSVFLLLILFALVFFSFRSYNNIQSAAVFNAVKSCNFEKVHQNIPLAGLRGTRFWIPTDLAYDEVRILQVSGDLTCNDCSLTVNGQQCYYTKGSVNREIVDLSSCLSFLKEGENTVQVTSSTKGSANSLAEIYVDMQVKPANC